MKTLGECLGALIIAVFLWIAFTPEKAGETLRAFADAVISPAPPQEQE